MFKNFIKAFEKHSGVIAGVFLALIYIVALTISWAVTCGIIWLVSLCFGLDISMRTATGIWLLIYLARTVFTHTITVKK